MDNLYRCIPARPHRHRVIRRLGALVLVVVALPLATAGAYDWSQFDGDARHSGNNTQETTITATNVAGLAQLFQVTLPSIADGAPVIQQNVPTARGTIDLLFVTTTDGRLIAMHARTGATIWSVQHGPGSCLVNGGANPYFPNSPCFTTSSPALDPNRQFVYAYGLDGFVHKHQVASGAEVSGGGWPEQTTAKPQDEKGSSALGIAVTPSGTFLYATNGGYPGDLGNYQGHVTAIDLATGAQRVFNGNCSDQPVHFVAAPATPDCAKVQTAIWARPGVVYDPETNRIYAATGNGQFDPVGHHWGDSIIALNPDGTGGASGNPVDTYTPPNEASLDLFDEDLGSAAPAILPTPAGCGAAHLGMQGGKDGRIRLIDLDSMGGNGTGQQGGERALLDAPGKTAARYTAMMLTHPAVWVNPADGAAWAFASTTNGIGGLRLACPGGVPTLQTVWSFTTATGPYGSTSSPLVANNVLYFMTNGGVLRAADPTTGATLWQTTIGTIHWQSPVVANGVLYISDQNSHLTAFKVTPAPPAPRSSGPGAPGVSPLPPARTPVATVAAPPAPAPPPRP